MRTKCSQSIQDLSSAGRDITTILSSEHDIAERGRAVAVVTMFTACHPNPSESPPSEQASPKVAVVVVVARN